MKILERPDRSTGFPTNFFFAANFFLVTKNSSLEIVFFRLDCAIPAYLIEQRAQAGRIVGHNSVNFE